MIVTKDELKRRFAEYNHMYFDDAMKMPTFCIKTNNDGVVGKFRYTRAGRNVEKPKIYIARFIDWTDDELKETLLHEMIHYHVVSVQHYFGPFSHGFRYRREVRRLKRDHGITVKRFATDLLARKRRCGRKDLKSALKEISGGQV